MCDDVGTNRQHGVPRRLRHLRRCCCWTTAPREATVWRTHHIRGSGARQRRSYCLIHCSLHKTRQLKMQILKIQDHREYIRQNTIWCWQMHGPGNNEYAGHRPIYVLYWKPAKTVATGSGVDRAQMKLQRNTLSLLRCVIALIFVFRTDAVLQCFWYKNIYSTDHVCVGLHFSLLRRLTLRAGHDPG